MKRKNIIILNIEDDESNQFLIEMLFDAPRYHVVNVTSGYEGVAKEKECNPDIIFLDLSLPDSSGFEIIEKLKCQNKEVKIVVVSANSYRSTKLRCERLGCSDYFTKPIDTEVFVDKIDQIISRGP